MKKNYDLGLGRQKGAVLAISLIMLLLVTLMAVSGFNMTQTSLKIMDNAQARQQVMVAANSAIEEAISSTRFTDSSQQIFSNACGPNQRCFDINADGVSDITVSMATPQCVLVEPVRNSDLDIANNELHRWCFGSGEYSLCAYTVWELRASAHDAVSQASADVRQGVALMVPANAVSTSCPN